LYQGILVLLSEASTVLTCITVCRSFFFQWIASDGAVDSSTNLSPSIPFARKKNFEETLTKAIDDLALTYLKTAVSQLKKKLEQITKLDAQITELIDEPGELARRDNHGI